MTIIRKVIKTGNSLAITIPTATIKAFNIKEGDLAQVKPDPNRAVISYLFSGHPRQLTLINKREPVKK